PQPLVVQSMEKRPPVESILFIQVERCKVSGMRETEGIRKVVVHLGVELTMLPEIVEGDSTRLRLCSQKDVPLLVLALEVQPRIRVPKGQTLPEQGRDETRRRHGPVATPGKASACCAAST